MQQEAYASTAETATPFSVSEPAPDDSAAAPILWSLKDAQWQILHMDFSRPPDRPARNYPCPRMLRELALILALNVNRKLGVTWISKSRLAEFMHLSPSATRAVQRGLRALEQDFGLLEFIEHEKPWQGRKYRLTVGWARGALERAQERAPTLDPVQATHVMRAYHVARLLRHECGGRHAKVSPVVLSATVRLVQDVAATTGESFEATAEQAMDVYMAIEGFDAALRKARHPLAWIEPHLTGIEAQLRRAHRRRSRKLEQTGPAEEPTTSRGESMQAVGAILASLRKGTS